MPRPRPTVRLRLTLLYGGLFVLSGALVLAITYALVDRATDDNSTVIALPGGGTASCSGVDEPSTGDDGSPEQSGRTGGDRDAADIPADPPDIDDCERLAGEQHAAHLRELLTQSSIALVGTTVISIVIGWIVAGRVLRPVRQITTATRTISATNLHQRLDHQGPDDELGDLANTIDDLLARLEHAFDAQRRFVANASHELRTPLARQRTLAQVALDDPDATASTLRQTHERILAIGAEQEKLIAALLALARSQSGVTRRQPIDLKEVVGDQITERRSDAGSRSITLTSELTPAPVTGDPQLIKQAISNLIDNAVVHNHPGGQVTLTTATNGHHTTLSVTNTGPVVPEDQMSRLLEPFQRVGDERTRHNGGFGLGLSIVQAIADAHDATLTTRPQPRGGLHVTLTF